jgi:hypothetical protein
MDVVTVCLAPCDTGIDPTVAIAALILVGARDEDMCVHFPRNLKDAI